MKKLRVFVAGIDHSGTSAVAGMLHHLGVPMLDEGAEMQRRDRYDLYEQREVQLANAALGRDPQTNGCWDAIIERRHELPIWGAKDPRFCYTFHRLVPLLDAPFRLITTHRQPDALRGSWKRNHRGTMGDFDELRNKQEALNSLGQYNPIVVSYEFLVRDPYAVATQLDLELGLDRPEAVIKTAAKFISEYKA